MLWHVEFISPIDAFQVKISEQLNDGKQNQPIYRVESTDLHIEAVQKRGAVSLS